MSWMRFPFRFEFVAPRLTRGQKWCTGVLCGLATTIWTTPSWYAPWADVSPFTLTAGVVIPAGWAWSGWIFKSAVDRHDRRKYAEQRAAEEQAAMVAQDRLQPRVRYIKVEPLRDGDVIEGEVLR